MNRYIIILTNFYSQWFLVSCLLSHIVQRIPSRERKISRFAASLKRSQDSTFSSSLKSTICRIAWIQFAIENSCVGSGCCFLTTVLLFFLAPWVGGMVEQLELPFTASILDLDLSLRAPCAPSMLVGTSDSNMWGMKFSEASPSLLGRTFSVQHISLG